MVGNGKNSVPIWAVTVELWEPGWKQTPNADPTFNLIVSKVQNEPEAACLKLCLHYATLLRACRRYFHECGFGLQAAQIWESCIYTAEDTCVIRWMIMNNWLTWLPEMPQSQSNRTESGLTGGARLCQRLLGASIWGCESSSKFFQWLMLHD